MKINFPIQLLPPPALYTILYLYNFSFTEQYSFGFAIFRALTNPTKQFHGKK